MASKGKTVTLKQVRSGAGRVERQRGTLKGLGLGKIGQTATLADTPEVRGMIGRVRHLVTVEE
jgi:large subunit ribosomal protein L30